MRTLLALAAASGLVGCATDPSFDAAVFHEHEPRSLLVLPPIDETLEVDAAYAYLATVTEPLAEQGYYVFPVAVVDRVLRDNGLPGPGEMHAVPLARLGEVFGADAVLFVHLKDWGTAYRVLDSITRVTVEARLVDVATGVELWRGQHTEACGSSAGGGSLVGILAGAVASQIASSLADRSTEVARDCNRELFADGRSGLPARPFP